MLFGNEDGSWFASDRLFLERYATDKMTPADVDFLRSGGFSFEREGDLAFTGFMHRWGGRHNAPAPGISYVILVPTLRCNLSCEYCQVSRAAENAQGYDWSEDTLAHTLRFLGCLKTTSIQIEFQGGEPLLRVDLLERVRDFCRQRFSRSSFVVCSNLQRMSADGWKFFDDEDTSLSTSIDGDAAIHTRQRTRSTEETERFFANVEEYVRRHGPARLSALPTVDIENPVGFEALVDQYARFGLRSIYLRPINRQGFARRIAPGSDVATKWADLHARFVSYLIERNYGQSQVFEEYYFTNALRRVLRSGVDAHVDLRNPNLLGDSYVVVDHDGKIYPTDEARMMARVGQVDLAIGHVATGIDPKRKREINGSSFNDLDADCQHCLFQPYCGTDMVDDISRHGRVDVPKADTWFCNRHLALFDLVFSLIRSKDPKVQYSLCRWAGVETWPSHLSEVLA